MIPYHKGWDLFIDWDPPIFAWKGRPFYMIRAGQWWYAAPSGAAYTFVSGH